MRRALMVCLFALPLLAGGCKEKSELKTLCSAPAVGDRSFETPVVAEAATLLRQAEQSEAIARDLEQRRREMIARREGMVTSAAQQRAVAEAMSLDDKDARRRAILDVTAVELEAKRLAGEIEHYQADVTRNRTAAGEHRRRARALLQPLMDRHGLAAACDALLRGPAAPKAGP